MLVPKYCVYVHKRKDNGQIFYVGRCSRHESTRNIGLKKYRRAYDFNQRSHRWFDVLREGGGVDVEIIHVTDDKDDVCKYEHDLVDVLGRELINNGLLVNECAGGRGAPKQPNSKVTRMKKSISKIGSRNPMYGKKGFKHPNSKAVVNTMSGNLYESVSQAAEECGYKMKTLYNWLSGHRKNPTDLRFL